MAQSLKVRGLKELNRDLGKANKGAQRRLQKELRKAGEPVAVDARSKASGHAWSAPTVSGLRVGTRQGGVVVRQRRSRTTGTRPDFGTLQMSLSLIPALEENEDKIVRAVEQIDWMAVSGGVVL